MLLVWFGSDDMRWSVMVQSVGRPVSGYGATVQNNRKAYFRCCEAAPPPGFASPACWINILLMVAEDVKPVSFAFELNSPSRIVSR